MLQSPVNDTFPSTWREHIPESRCQNTPPWTSWMYWLCSPTSENKSQYAGLSTWPCLVKKSVSYCNCYQRDNPTSHYRNWYFYVPHL